ncbi:MAG: hypothetical protein QG597_4892, partial [Actinomycetota bacterium]|nr:hypothetical protein [Actinomycetota bacterium]
MTETLNPRPVVLGGYAAKTCPEKLRLEHDPAYADLPLEPFPAGVQARMDAGNVFEAEVRAAWSKVLRRKMAILDSGDGSWEAKGAREAATLALLASPGAVTVIWNPRLPAQPGAHRIGEPDALVLDHVDAAGAARWIPVDVKDHRALDGTAAHTTVASPLNRPGYASARPVDIGPGTPRRDDALQLAHYRRMLEHLGHATDVPVGAIIGREMQLIWHDLDAALYRHGTLGKTSALTWYDHEFARRVQIATIARSGTSTPAPEWKADCASCPWRKVCHDELTATDHATLLPGVTPDRAGRLLYPAGITTRRQLAAWQATGEKTDTQIRPLADQARVTLAGKVHRARGIDTVTLPHATVEVDFDLENTPDGLVYLIVLTTTTT